MVNTEREYAKWSRYVSPKIDTQKELLNGILSEQNKESD
jgi:hypothetical protein